MAEWRGYFAIEDLALTAGQRQTLRAAIMAFYQDNQVPTRQPAEILHWRISLDASKVILEAKFDDALLTLARFKQFLANTFNVDVANISNSGGIVHYGDAGTPNTPWQDFIYSGTARIRVAFFAGVNCTWDESHTAALAYLDANRAEWDSAVA